MWRESKQVINIFSLILYFFPFKSVFLPLWKCISSFLKLYFWCVLVEGLQVINCRCTGNGSIGRISPRYWTSIYPNIRNTSFQRISPRYWTSIRNTSFQRIQPRYWTRRASIPSSKTQVFNTFDHWSPIQLHISSSTCNIIPHSLYSLALILDTSIRNTFSTRFTIDRNLDNFPPIFNCICIWTHLIIDRQDKNHPQHVTSSSSPWP